ncbi:MAG: D-alanyl-D-alanine carboxypeptidase family protein [Mediterraneibacter sp.]
MKIRRTLIGLACSAVLILTALFPAAREARAQETGDEITASQLYAQSAVLMDADSGRILFAKNGQEERAMASTTKIMTCILALENGDLSEEITVSAEAASQPAVRLGMREGQRFRLNDLLYSLMLESHNDSAVAVAECVGGTVEGFAAMMNRKAMELGCSDTYFITPNGLDAEDETGKHHTTAADLARIMKYCIMDSEKKDAFLEITRTESYQFSDCDVSGSYSCSNHNSFLHMMEGALSGKTGFTADAGYCYVGALRRDDRTFIVALLACGWPNNKGYKWSDTRKLMDYALENYQYREFGMEEETVSVVVENGTAGGFPGADGVQIGASAETEPFRVLLKSGEEIDVEYDVPESVEAPVEKGQTLGTVIYSLNSGTLREYPLTADASVRKRDFSVCLSYIRDCFFLASG